MAQLLRGPVSACFSSDLGCPSRVAPSTSWAAAIFNVTIDSRRWGRCLPGDLNGLIDGVVVPTI